MDYKACWDYQELLFNQTIQQKILNRNLPITENVVTKNYLLNIQMYLHLEKAVTKKIFY